MPEENDVIREQYERTIQQLTRRIEALEEKIGQSAPIDSLTIRCPFRIVDEEGKLILEISRTEFSPSYMLALFNGEGKRSVSLHGEHPGGSMALQNSEGKLVFYATTESYGGHLSINNVSEGGMYFFNDETGCGVNMVHSEDKLGVTIYAQSEGGEITVYSRNEEVELILNTSEE